MRVLVLTVLFGSLALGDLERNGESRVYLRSEGRSWTAIAVEMGIGEGTARRAATR